ncbi:hypothetical protein KJ359_005233 [Pestalotiopsis sp. 9143b]|nr:hypothetical protein KJ359_005233 [Pestalotiopsis sp. 9143b]
MKETLALKLKDLVDGLDSAASSVRTFTGNVSSDDLAHLESSYDSASNDTQAYLDDTRFIKQPRFLTKRICDRIQDAGTKFTDLGSAVADKLDDAVKLGTSDDDKDVLKLTVDRIKGRSDAIQGALTHAASKCYDHLSTGESSSVASSTANSTTIVTTTAVPLPPGVVVVSVVNTVTAPCSCGHGLSPRTAAGSSDGPVTTTFFDPNPTTTASITGTDDEALPSTYIMSIFTDTTVSCVCETATRHHHATATETTTKKHLTTVTATATAESEDSGAVANVVGSLGLVAGLFVFLL